MKKKLDIVSRLICKRRGRSKFGKKRLFQFIIIVFCWVLWSLFSPESVDDFKGKSESSFVDFYEESTALEKSSPDIIRVCTWNVRNYSVAGRRVDGKYVQAPKPESEKLVLRKILKDINADVLLIQEMGDMEFLRELRSDLNREGLSYSYIAVTRYDSPSRLAIMSKIKPSNIIDCCDIKFPFKGDNRFSPRGVLGFEFDSYGTRWYAFSIHLKSSQGARKSDKNFFPFRAAEMKAIDSRIFKETKGNNNIIIGGDFNQEPAKMLLDSMKKLKLSPLAQFDDKGESHTYFWSRKNVYYKYDFFLSSNFMANFVEKNATIFNSGFTASDHRPVHVDLDFKKLKKSKIRN